MNCPLCNVELKMTDRQGIEVDYCPQCRGVWLDRGELDKILERSLASFSQNEPKQGYPAEHKDYESYGKQKSEDRYPKRKKKSFLNDLFDFD